MCFIFRIYKGRLRDSDDNQINSRAFLESMEEDEEVIMKEKIFDKTLTYMNVMNMDMITNEPATLRAGLVSRDQAC
jgi:hypothetical protein